MIDSSIIRPAIALNDFLPIFVSSALVLIFGGVYVGIFTAVKTKMLKSWMMIVGYLFWILTAYCLYIMGSLMHVDSFTARALVITGIGLFIVPHSIYYIQNRVHEENEH